MPLYEGFREWNKHLGKTEKGVFLGGDEAMNSHRSFPEVGGCGEVIF
jgi:hypothetical protein